MGTAKNILIRIKNKSINVAEGKVANGWLDIYIKITQRLSIMPVNANTLLLKLLGFWIYTASVKTIFRMVTIPTNNAPINIGISIFRLYNDHAQLIYSRKNESWEIKEISP